MAAGLTLANLRSLLRDHLDDLGADRFSDARLLLLLNEGQREIQKIVDAADEHFFSKAVAYTVLTTTDALEFTLPDDLLKVIQVERQVSGGNAIPAIYVDFRSRHRDSYATEWVGDTSASDSPRFYVRGNKLGVIDPTESYTLRLWYTYAVPDLVGDGDFSEIPNEYRGLIALHAAKLAQGADEANFSADLNALYEAGIARLTAYIENRQRHQPRRVHYVPD
jgi:hypothetical protein